MKHGLAFDGQYFTDATSTDVLLTPGNFAIGGGFKADKLKYYRGPVPDEFVLQAGDLVVTMTDLSKQSDTLGYAAVVPRHRKHRYLHNQRIGRVEISRPDLVDPSFLHWLLRGPEYRAEVLASATGTTVKHTAPGRIEAHCFLAPSVQHQRAIAHILGTLDDKIELNRRMNETLEAIARALFKSWFVDFDPVRAQAEGRAPSGMDAETAKLFSSEFVESELGAIPKGWRAVCLAGLTSKIGSGATPRGGDKAYVEHGVSLIRSQNVYDSAFTWDGLVHLTRDDAVRLDGVTVHHEDVLLNITGASILRTCVADPAVLPARVNQHVAIVRTRDGIPPRFIHNHLLRPATKNYLIGMDAGASRQAVTKGHIESVPIVEPTSRVLAMWQRIVGPLYARQDARLTESRSLTALRDTLLPRLLAGTIDAKRIDGESGAPT